jgi:hypothetical protein
MWMSLGYTLDHWQHCLSLCCSHQQTIRGLLKPGFRATYCHGSMHIPSLPEPSPVPLSRTAALSTLIWFQITIVQACDMSEPAFCSQHSLPFPWYHLKYWMSVRRWRMEWECCSLIGSGVWILGCAGGAISVRVGLAEGPPSLEVGFEV